MKRQKTAQKVQMRLTPGRNVVKVVARGDRCTDHHQQHLRQGMRHMPAIARVFNDREMLQKNGKTRLGTNSFHEEGSRYKKHNRSESQNLQNPNTFINR